MACSALRRTYREALVPPGALAGEVRFVYLHADAALTAGAETKPAKKTAAKKAAAPEAETAAEDAPAKKARAKKAPVPKA